MALELTKVFDKNLDAFLAGKKLIINQGGTSSSKSYSIMQLLLLIAHRRKVLISIVSETMPHLKRGIMRDFFDLLKAEDLYIEANHNKTDNIYQMNEGKIEFFSCDSPARVHGPRRDILFVNECNNITYETYTQLDIRTKDVTFLDFNPVAPFWVLEIPKIDNVEWIISTYRDNQFLSPKIIRAIESRRESHPEWYRVYGEGEWGELQDSIFTNWKQCKSMPKDARLLGFGLDFGFTNDPAALVELRIMDGELYFKEHLYETGLTNRDLSKKFEECGLVRGMDEIWADCAEPKSIRELKDAGWLIRGASKGTDSVRKGIDLMKQYKINITEDSLNIIKDFRYYRWQRDKQTDKLINKPLAGWDHGTDAARYICMMKLGKKKRFLKQWN
jgi:phage terminase large subunit